MLKVFCLFFQIVNLKRFQFLNGRWVKSHKIVKFPLENFDPSCYLAPRKRTVSKNVICNCDNLSDQSEDSRHDNSSPDSQSEHFCHGNQQSPMPNAEGDNVNKVCDKNNPGKCFLPKEYVNKDCGENNNGKCCSLLPKL